MSEALNLKQFKEQVLSDYRMACAGREALRSARHEADCHFVTANGDVGQVALARFVEPADAYVSAGLDLTAEMAMGRQTPHGFFGSLFSSATDIYAHGTASRMAVAAGMALADASRGAGQGERRRIVVCTACGDFGADGDFLESVCYAAARSLPLCIVLWNNNGTTSNGNLIRQLSGFGQTVKGRRTLAIEAVRGGDYAALCRVMATQTDRARTGQTTLTFVSGAEGEMETFGKWLEERHIATRQQTAEIEAEARQEVERERRRAYLSSLVSDTPLRQPHHQPMDIAPLFARAAMPLMPMGETSGAVNKAIGVARAGLLPLVTATAADIRSSLLTGYPDAKIVVRTTTTELGTLMACSSGQTEIWTPACRAEAEAAYSQLLSNPRQAIVVEAGTETPTGTPTAGGAQNMTEGEDATLLSFGPTTQPAADATRLMRGQDARVEHIHLMTLRPLDTRGVVAASLRKTKRLAIVDSDPSGLTARLVIAHLAQSPDGLRHLMAPPAIILPRSPLRPAEPRDICVEISKLLG